MSHRQLYHKWIIPTSNSVTRSQEVFEPRNVYPTSQYFWVSLKMRKPTECSITSAKKKMVTYSLVSRSTTEFLRSALISSECRKVLGIRVWISHTTRFIFAMQSPSYLSIEMLVWVVKRPLHPHRTTWGIRGFVYALILSFRAFYSSRRPGMREIQSCWAVIWAGGLYTRKHTDIHN